MALDLEEISKKIDEWYDSAECQKYFDDMRNRNLREEEQLERFHRDYAHRLDELVEKAVTYYESEAYRNKWRGKNREEPNGLFNFLMEYAQKYGHALNAQLPNTIYFCDFATETYGIGKWVVQTIYGQGAFTRVFDLSKNNKFNFTQVLDTNRYKIFHLGGEPEVLHIVKSGIEDNWFIFWEDAHELEPYQSGITMLESAAICFMYGITL